MIQERFNQLQPYLKGVKIAGSYFMVECILKNTWKITGISSNDVTHKSGKESEEHKGFTSYLFYSETKTLDELVDNLELIINLNIEMEQKQALLKSKVEELKKIFEDKPLDELKSLKFSSEIDLNLNNKPESSNHKIKDTDELVKRAKDVIAEKI